MRGIHKDRQLIMQSIGIICLAVGLFIMRVPFFEHWTFISPDHEITSLDFITAIVLLRALLIACGFLFIAYPDFVFRAVNSINPFIDRYNKKRMHVPPFSFILFLVLVLLLYLVLMFGGFLHQVSGSKAADTDKLGIFTDMFDTATFFYGTFLTTVNTREIDYGRIDIPVYRVYVREELIGNLNADLPDSGMKFVDGHLIFNNTTYRSKARYRGDTILHWYFKKKSWRIKLKDKQAIDFSNKFNLINPKSDSHLKTLVGYKIADKIGLLAPRSYHAALILNNQYEGLYYYSDQIDELFLRMRGKVPGDIFYGDFYNGSAHINLFNSLDNWHIKGTVDNNENRAWKNIKFFIESINRSSPEEFYNFFNNYLGDDYLKFYAYNIFIGDYHLDNIHNHKLYFNPTNGLFEPVVWDQIPVADLKLPLTTDHNVIFEKINNIPEFVEKKNRYIYEFIDEIPEKSLYTYIDETSSLIDYEMKHDKYKDAAGPPWSLTYHEWKQSVKDLKRDICTRYVFIRQQLNKVDVTINIVDNTYLIFDVAGESGVRIDELQLTTQSESHSTCYSLFKDTNFDMEPQANEKIQEECGDVIDLNIGILYPGKNNTLRYIYILQTNNKNELSIRDTAISNSVTGEEVVPTVNFLTSFDELPEITSHSSLHPWKILPIQNKTITLEGTETLTKDLILNRGDKLIIRPGTTIKLAPGVSIISHGSITAEGTQEMPIRFLPLNHDQPWGAVALQGNGANGSSFTHCLFEGGSGAKHELVHYTGMLSAYNTELTIDSCTFHDNKIEDDAFNAKYSQVMITNSKFMNTFGDAIDFDFSEGSIENNDFMNMGNDAIDLMTSSPLIKDNFISQAGDKGISIGEISNPTIIKNMISSSDMGIAIKDLSNPLIINTTLKNNRVGVAAYSKNWMYGGGGRGVILGSELCQNTIPILLQNASVVEIQQGDESIQCTEGECELKCETNQQRK